MIGVAFALLQFAAVKRVAAGVLASSAVLGLIVGFAARQTLANGVAGILLAITQPIRVDDLVTFQGETGTVEDVRLTYTHVRLDDGRRLIIPNEQLAVEQRDQPHDRRPAGARGGVDLAARWTPTWPRRSRSSRRSRTRRSRWPR